MRRVQFGAGVTRSGTTSANLDPSSDEVWAALDALFGELAEMFPDGAVHQVHVGFDEVGAYTERCRSTPSVRLGSAVPPRESWFFHHRPSRPCDSGGV